MKGVSPEGDDAERGDAELPLSVCPGREVRLLQPCPRAWQRGARPRATVGRAPCSGLAEGHWLGGWRPSIAAARIG